MSEHKQKEDQIEDENSLEDDDFDLSNFSEEDEESVVGNWAKKFGILVFEVVKVVLISLAIILPVRLFLVQPFYVEGASMEPSFYEKEYLIIDEISYRFNEPQRGEVVIFKSPQNPRSYFIKRIIGLPGETVEIKNGKIFIDNEKELSEDYLQYVYSDTHTAVILESGQYFVLGDNRTNSLDSRQFGSIEKDSIIGRVWIRGWPFDRINTFNAPNYGN